MALKAIGILPLSSIAVAPSRIQPLNFRFWHLEVGIPPFRMSWLFQGSCLSHHLLQEWQLETMELPSKHPTE